MPIRTDPGFQVDADSMATIVATDEHLYVHKGEAFEASYKTPVGSDLGNAVSMQILFKTPPPPINIHWVFEVSAGGDFDLTLLEGPTVTASASALTPLNKNRQLKNKLSAASIYLACTTTASGQILHHGLLPGGLFARGSSGGEDRDEKGWILSPDTIYVWRCTNISGGAEPFSFSMLWHEWQ